MYPYIVLILFISFLLSCNSDMKKNDKKVVYLSLNQSNNSIVDSFDDLLKVLYSLNCESTKKKFLLFKKNLIFQKEHLDSLEIDGKDLFLKVGVENVYRKFKSFTDDKLLEMVDSCSKLTSDEMGVRYQSNIDSFILELNEEVDKFKFWQVKYKKMYPDVFKK